MAIPYVDLLFKNGVDDTKITECKTKIYTDEIFSHLLGITRPFLLLQLIFLLFP